MQTFSVEFFLEKLLTQLLDPSYLKSFALIGALLAGGQIFNAIRLSGPSASETDKKVKVIISSWWKIVLAVFLAFAGGKYTAIPLFYILSLYALREYIGVSALRDQPTRLLIGGAIGISLHYMSLVLQDYFLFFASIQLYSLLVLMPFIIFTSNLDRLPQVIAFYLGVMVMGVLLSFPVAILTFESDIFGSATNARIAVLLLIVLTEVNDILQFICGKLFGRRKVIPAISPNKTEAGFIGGAILSTLLAVLLWPKFIPLNWPQAAILGFLLSIAGMLGDLVFSAIKRYRGVKDFSALIPGHGGVLDRVDSLLATGPVFFYFLYFWKQLSP